MNYGYVKVAAAVPRVHVADCKFNAGQIEKEIIIADGKGVQIIAFPELCITGYTCGDLFAQQLLLEEAELRKEKSHFFLAMKNARPLREIFEDSLEKYSIKKILKEKKKK